MKENGGYGGLQATDSTGCSIGVTASGRLGSRLGDAGGLRVGNPGWWALKLPLSWEFTGHRWGEEHGRVSVRMLRHISTSCKDASRNPGASTRIAEYHWPDQGGLEYVGGAVGNGVHYTGAYEEQAIHSCYTCERYHPGTSPLLPSSLNTRVIEGTRSTRGSGYPVMDERRSTCSRARLDRWTSW